MENALLREVKAGQTLLFLWQNRPSVVIGRNQNPWHEAALSLMEREGVLLIRRPSGGGAVYHDEGNLNFSFIEGRADGPMRTREHLEWILRALKEEWGIHQAQATEHNDLVVSALKFSGSAFRHTKGHTLHHGTLLIQSDLSRLHRYLNPLPHPWEGERPFLSGVPSKKSPTINLHQLNPSLTVDCMAQSLAKVGGIWPDSKGEEEFLEKMRSWSWRFGQTPAFSQVIIHHDGTPYQWDIRHGLVEKIHPHHSAAATAAFLHKPYGYQAVEQFLSM